MRKAWALVAVLVVGLCVVPVQWAFAGFLNISPKVLAGIHYPMPSDASEREYLGLDKGDSFRLPQVDAKVLIVEVFSMYCPYCQAEAPNVNNLYSLIEKTPRLKGKVKIVGIGARNTSYEVGVFKKKYQIPFPLVPDPKFLTQKCTSERLRTPTFIVVTGKKDMSLDLITVHLGKIGNLEKFLDQISPK